MAKPRRDPKTGRFLPKHLVYIDNLKILGHAEHGAVSASQHWCVKQHDIHLEKDWESRKVEL
jgi:hypothetical protein